MIPTESLSSKVDKETEAGRGPAAGVAVVATAKAADSGSDSVTTRCGPHEPYKRHSIFAPQLLCWASR